MKNRHWILFSIALLIFILIPGCGYTPDQDESGADDEPGYFAATDGTLTDSIGVDWGVIDEAYADEVYFYIIERSKYNTNSYSQLDNCTVTNYTDNSVIPGIIYFYRVKAVYNDNTTSNYSNEDSGFAMNAQILQIGSAFAQFPLNSKAGTQENQWVWFKILAQQGWTYTIQTYEDTVPVDTFLYLYKDPMIDAPVISNDDITPIVNLYSSVEYTFPASQIYYIKVAAFAADSVFNISMWYH